MAPRLAIVVDTNRTHTAVFIVATGRATKVVHAALAWIAIIDAATITRLADHAIRLWTDTLQT